MAKFNKGDKVRCLRAWHPSEVVGQVYTVSSADAGKIAPGHIRLEELGLQLPEHAFDQRRYELVQGPSAPKEFAYRVCGPHTTMHGRFSSAEEAAEVLRKSGTLGLEYEIVEVSVVQTVTPRRTLEVKQ